MSFPDILKVRNTEVSPPKLPLNIEKWETWENVLNMFEYI